MSSWIIAGLQRVGLAWNVVRITPERQQAKQAKARVPAHAAR